MTAGKDSADAVYCHQNPDLFPEEVSDRQRALHEMVGECGEVKSAAARDLQFKPAPPRQPSVLRQVVARVCPATPEYRARSRTVLRISAAPEHAQPVRHHEQPPRALDRRRRLRRLELPLAHRIGFQRFILSPVSKNTDVSLSRTAIRVPRLTISITHRRRRGPATGCRNKVRVLPTLCVAEKSRTSNWRSGPGCDARGSSDFRWQQIVPLRVHHHRVRKNRVHPRMLVKIMHRRQPAGQILLIAIQISDHSALRASETARSRHDTCRCLFR